MVEQRKSPLTETHVRRIAEEFVRDKQLDPCVVVAVRRGSDLETDRPVWYVQFQFDSADDESASHTFVQIDDATGEPQLIESL
jgi:hypothetical protein